MSQEAKNEVGVGGSVGDGSGAPFLILEALQPKVPYSPKLPNPTWDDSCGTQVKSLSYPGQVSYCLGFF